MILWLSLVGATFVIAAAALGMLRRPEHRGDSHGADDVDYPRDQLGL